MTDILVTLDGSALSEAILPKAASLARDTRANVTLLTVAEIPSDASLGREERGNPWQAMEEVPAGIGQFGGQAPTLEPTMRKPVESEDQVLDRFRNEAQHYLTERSLIFRDRGVPVETQVLIAADPEKAILRYANDHHFDVIAMATHGRSGLNELVHGSVAESIVQSGVAPVMLMRPAA